MSSPRRRAASRRKEKPTGSPYIGEPVFVLVGILRRAHGLKGEALVTVETGFPERLQNGRQLYLGEDHMPVKIRSRREGPDGLLLAFTEFSTRESLSQFRNLPLFVRVADIPPLPAGKFYQHQLIGLDVVTDDGRHLGKLAEIMDTSANDVYIVRGSVGEVLLPATTEVIRKIDLESRKIIIHLIPGLLGE